MFMIEKALIVIMFLLAISMSELVGQYVIADIFKLNLTSFDGKPIKSNIVSLINISNFNTITGNVTNTSRNSVVNNPIPTAAGIAWEMLLLLTGTYIFNLLYLLGVPPIAVVMMVVIYLPLMIRAIIGYIRGI